MPRRFVCICVPIVFAIHAALMGSACFLPVRSITGAILPMMKDPLQVLDYERWWRKDLNNILPFTFSAVNQEVIGKMEVQLEDSANRIGNTRANGDAIVLHLQGLINDLQVDHVHPFSWNLKVYKSPPQERN